MMDMPKPPTWSQSLALLKHPDMLKIVPIYGLGLIPIAIFLAWVGTRIDHWLGWGPFPPYPWNYIGLVLGLGLGLAILIRSYTCLIHVAETSPTAPRDQTRGLVKVGPYSWIRHPSVVGKLLGVLGLGCLIRSSSFLFIIIPLLLIYSIITNRIWQEIPLEKKFGEDYHQYKREVPMLIPFPSRVVRFISGGKH